jgi:hypothetical protein
MGSRRLKLLFGELSRLAVIPAERRIGILCSFRLFDDSRLFVELPLKEKVVESAEMDESSLTSIASGGSNDSVVAVEGYFN